MTSVASLTGALHVRPGAPLPTIRSTRREWAPTLGRGRPAQALPELLAAVFTLCGGAHRVAARHALGAVLGQADDQATAAHQALQVDTLREHLRRLWLDAPRQVPTLSAPDPAELATCPLLRQADGVDASRAWIEQWVLGQPAVDWLAGWTADPAAQAARWAEGGATWPARWLQAVRRQCQGLQQRVVPLQAHASAQELRRLVREMRRDDDFALAPTWRGRTAETGCWTRLADPVAPQADTPYTAVWLRHAARVADVARLLAPGGDLWLAHGRLQLDDATPGRREGLGWCEMARGLLLHWVQLDDQGLVTACRLVAPTEWNFHPFGSAARALAQLPPQADDARVHAVVGAYDPCVAVERGREPERSHA